MANNRMYLLHRPTGEMVYLGKRMAVGWYDAPENLSEKISRLFEAVEGAVGQRGQDDFCVLLEDAAGATLAAEIDSPSVNVKRDIIHWSQLGPHQITEALGHISVSAE